MSQEHREGDVSKLRGLIGGTPELRKARKSALPPLEHPAFLAPLDRPAHAEALRTFAQARPLAVEVGFGKGLFLTRFLEAHPDWRLLGIEVKRKLCEAALARLDKAGLENGRILLGDARILLPRFLSPETIDVLFVLFPDPWWKKKHHKRRLLHPETLRPLLPLLAKEALLVVRSDVPMVLEQAEETARALGCFAPVGATEMALPVTDRERNCDRIGIAHDQRLFRYEPTEAGS